MAKEAPQTAPNRSPLAGLMARMGAAWDVLRNGTTIWMGPEAPVVPSVPEVQAESVRGRQFDYPVGTNLIITPRANSVVTYEQMRALADSCDILRLVIETRKDEMAKLSFAIVPKDDKKEPDARCKEVEDFFAMPDGENTWQEWLRQLLEELFVVDAPAIYPWLTNGSKPYRFELLDGTTIKRVIDPRGRTPAPPLPAYQQILKGVVAVNYTADELAFKPRNKRVHKLYGYSPVEQIIQTVNIAIRRALYQLQYYTEGSAPDLLFQTPADWSLQGIKDFNSWWTDSLAGNTAMRRKVQFVPHGVTPVNTKEAILKDAYDEWLARIICYAFSVSSQWAVKEVNRATAETALKQAKDEGLAPIMLWVQDLVNLLIWKYFKYADLKFMWIDDKNVVKPEEQAKIDDTNLKNGSKTLNEVRTSRGDAPIEGGDEPMVLTSSGYVPVFQEPEELDESGQPLDQGDGATEGDEAGDAGDDAKGKKPGKKSPKANAKDDAKDDPTTGKGKKPQAAKDDAKKVLKGVKKVLTPIDRDRPEVKKQEALLVKELKAVLKKLKAKVVADVTKVAGPVWEDVYGNLSTRLMKITRNGTMAAAAQLDLDDPDMLKLANKHGVEWAKARAAELIGMKYDAETGNLVENPDADYSLEDSTRAMVQSDITRALEEGLSNDDLADLLEENYAFSDTRAVTIARTETAKADIQGSLELYLSTGEVAKKQWLVGAGCCDECQALDGLIVAIEDTFKGNEDPPLHPNCRCDILPVLSDDEE